MKILVTNDDGITAPGLLALTERLSQIAEVYVAAPDHNCTANSHHLTLDRAIRVRECAVPFAKAAIAVDGTPADCVKLAVTTWLQGHGPDFVASGINSGANLSTDCLYSGTLGAASEAYLMQIPSLAVSLDDFSPTADFSYAADIAARYVVCTQQQNRKTIVMNINVPACCKNDIHGIRLTEINKSQLRPESYTCVEKPDGKYYTYDFLIGQHGELSDDVQAVKNGFVSFTPISCFRSDMAALYDLRTDKAFLSYWGVE